ncbi:MAG: signal recognition particle subunit SRP19/SEC65 family protein [Archaeoglobaceae archaeon]
MPKKENEMVIWTANIDRKKTRGEGRKIPRKMAVPNVKLNEMVEACKKMGIRCTPETNRYPRSWWEEGGRVRVPKDGIKSQLMDKISREISQIRNVQEEEAKSKGKGKSKGKSKGKKK